MAYAASDVLHLHALRERLDAMLAREGRTELARACFEFLPSRAKLDLSHSVSLIHNERTKLTATWLNGLATAAVAVGSIAPSIAAVSGTISPILAARTRPVLAFRRCGPTFQCARRSWAPEGYAMSPHDYTWLLFATPAAVAAIGALVYYVTARQDRAESHHGR